MNVVMTSKAHGGGIIEVQGTAEGDRPSRAPNWTRCWTYRRRLPEPARQRSYAAC
jgi:hypothetical protein